VDTFVYTRVYESRLDEGGRDPESRVQNRMLRSITGSLERVANGEPVVDDLTVLEVFGIER
jgi:hypothetical protein